ncbi:uncharacterized protein LOC143869939 [Tasmannia lanceolata]|uniref:uncharacterized protein LOC143869939 n=1 Tax=Tasmannia lanceolata TaxID=3420 RepID=UPI0040648D0C
MDPPVNVDPSLGMTTYVGATPTSSATSSSFHPPLATVKNSYRQLNIAKFYGTNYLPWTVAIETYLFGRGKVSFLRQDPPSPKDPSYTRLEQEDALIRRLIWQSMTPAIYSTMILLLTAKEIWDHTAVTYSRVENLTRIHSTYSKWMRLRHGDMSLEAHYGQFISLCQQLDVFLPLTSDVNVLRRQREHIRVAHYLESLGPEFTHLRHQILGSGRILSLHEAYSRAQQCLGETPSRPTYDSSALAAYDDGSGTRPLKGGGSFSRARGRGGRVGSGHGRPYCTYCQRDGHMIETCYTLHPELRPPCSTHLTTPGQSDTAPPASGSSSTDDLFTFTRADYEELQHFRQSASQATAGFAQPDLWRTIGSSREVDGLYHLDCSPSSTALHSSVDAFQWHYRLGHPSLQHLQQTSLVPASISHFQCQSCELGKHHRVSFPSRVVSRVDSLFQLVHSDVWEPSRVASNNGFKYFIVFIDDFSHMTCVYLLKDRSQVFFAFKNFYAEITNQFGCSLKCLRTDNALEFVLSTNGFQDYLSSHGITHQSSCAYTSQQNGVAERKLCENPM